MAEHSAATDRFEEAMDLSALMNEIGMRPPAHRLRDAWEWTLSSWIRTALQMLT